MDIRLTAFCITFCGFYGVPSSYEVTAADERWCCPVERVLFDKLFKLIEQQLPKRLPHLTVRHEMVSALTLYMSRTLVVVLYTIADS